MKTSKLLMICLTFFLIQSVFATHSHIQVNQTSLHTNSTSWTWSNIQVISRQSINGSEYPDSAVDSQGNVHLVWADPTPMLGSQGGENIFYREYFIGNSSWGNSQLVTSETTGSANHAAIAIDKQNNIHVVWNELTAELGSGNDIDIFYKMYNSTNGAWGTTVLISSESTLNSGFPSITVDGLNNVHIVWEDLTDYKGAGAFSHIFYKKYDATSKSWSDTILISSESTDNANKPKIVADNNNGLHVVWYDYSNYDNSGTDADIFYKEFNTQSQSWTASQVISSISDGISWAPNLVVDTHGHVYIVWSDASDPFFDGSFDYDIFFREFNKQWGPTQLISQQSNADSLYADIAVGVDGSVYVTWMDPSNLNGAGYSDEDIFYMSRDPVGNWQPEQVISQDPGYSGEPTIAYDPINNFQYIFWDDYSVYNNIPNNNGLIFGKYFQGLPDAPVLNQIVPTESHGAVDLTWDPVPGVTNYNVYRSQDPIHSLTGLQSIATTSANYSVDHPQQEGDYYYVVTSNNVLGEGSISNLDYVYYAGQVQNITSTQNTTQSTSKSSTDWNPVDGVVNWSSTPQAVGTAAVGVSLVAALFIVRKVRK